MRKITMILTAFIISFIVFSEDVVEASEEKLVEHAKQHIGTEYEWGGTSPSGFDCSGYLNYVYQQVGVDLPRTVASIYQEGESVSKSNLQVGDMVFYSTYKSGPSHAGIYIGDGQFIHASSSNGVTISDVDSPYYWGPRYIGAKRVVDFDDKQQEVVHASKEVQRQFSDLPESHWAYQAVDHLHKEDVINGVSEHQFAPSKSITRAEAVALLIRTVDFDPTLDSDFNDVDGHWSEPEVASAEELGHLDYIDGKQLKVREAIDRAEAARLMSNVYRYDFSGNGESFSDVPQTMPEYEDIMALKEQGVVEGMGNGLYEPNKTLTRAEFAKMIYEALK